MQQTHLNKFMGEFKARAVDIYIFGKRGIRTVKLYPPSPAVVILTLLLVIILGGAGFALRSLVAPTRDVVRPSHYNSAAFLAYSAAYMPLVRGVMGETPDVANLPHDCGLLREALATGVPYYYSYVAPTLDQAEERLYALTYMLVNGTSCSSLPPSQRLPQLSKRSEGRLISEAFGILSNDS